MARTRLRTKFLISLLVVSAGLTCATLLIVRRSISLQVRKEIADDLRNSVLTFRNFQQQTDAVRLRSAELMAIQPQLRALMTAPHPATIQDSSADIFHLVGGDLLLLADRSGKVVALYPPSSGITLPEAQELLQHSLVRAGDSQWWFGGGRLYQVYLQPIYFDPSSESSPLGVLAVGYEVNNRVAENVSRIANSEVAFWFGNSVVVSTLSAGPLRELPSRMPSYTLQSTPMPLDVQLGNETFLTTSLTLGPSPSAPVRLMVLKSYDQEAAFLQHLNRLLVLVGLLAISGGSLLVFLISHTFTRPLEALVDGVRALEKGNFSYPLETRGGDEIGELSKAFDRMRQSILAAQQQLLESERLATIGRMASSISHDLRHPLTAVVANAEFLCDNRLAGTKPEDLYQEIRAAVKQITDLIDSLLEFSKGRESLRPVYGSLRDVLEETLKAVRGLPEFQHVQCTLLSAQTAEGWFDIQKMRRAFYNVLRNAFEAAPALGGTVEVMVSETADRVEVLIADNGSGIPADIRDRLFEPFVSYGKANGTGLGLTIAQKIFQDHGGDIELESTAAGRTVFKVVIPRPPELNAPARHEKPTSITAASDLV